tara:strand:- start:30449 stop:31510 length:1062 start_codon:yes stop_codon:yes gene_type:complete
MKLKGYNFSRPFLGERAPQHVQNIVIRNYCEKNNHKFLLSSTEYAKENSFYILQELISNLYDYDGLVFYSLFQLPVSEDNRKLIYNKIIRKKKTLHFAVENLILKTKSDQSKIEEIFKIKIAQTKNNKNQKLGKLKNYLNINHNKVKRDYLERMNNKKVICMKKAKEYGFNYWDGDRKYGYGGYYYIPGYHEVVARKLIKDYKLNNGSKILDIGCGKGFLLYEIKKILKGIQVVGLDFSNYAIKKSKSEIKKYLIQHDINNGLKIFKEKSFDLVLCINTLHNIKLKNIQFCLGEIERVGINKFICVESFKNDKQQFNLQCWALTAETIINTDDWKWLFKQSNYNGDYEFIFFD